MKRNYRDLRLILTPGMRKLQVEKKLRKTPMNSYYSGNDSLKNWNVHVKRNLVCSDDVKETKLKQLFVRLTKKGIYNHAIKKTKQGYILTKQKGH